MTHSTPAPVADIRTLIADDAYAMSFQTMGQYRSALLKALAALHPQPAPAVAVEALTDDEIWRFWCNRPGVPDGEDDSMEAQFVAAVRRLLAARPSPPTMLNGLTEAESQWISVEDRLPDTDRRVLACNPLGYVGAATYHAGHWNGIGRAHGWMELPKPLPAPPTVGSGSATEGKAK